MNLLIVDDHPTNLKLLRAQLESEGHAVFEAHDGLDALALLNRQRVDAVISDILMPRMDGYRLCHEIRMNERLHDLPIIIYTSTYTSPGDEKLALDVGADKYLKKPASVETLVAALHEVIAKPHAAPRPEALREVEVLKEYSERLVSKLEEKNTELTAAEVKFRSLVEQSIVGIYIVQDDQFVYVNPGMAGIFGWSEKEMTSRTLYDFIVPEDHALVRENIRRRISGKEPNCHYYLRVLHQSGAVLQVEVHDSRTDYNGRPAVMGTLLDITERKTAEAKIQRLSNLYAALSQCNQAIVRCTSESQLFSQICRDVVTFDGVKMAWIGMLDEQRRQIVPVAAYGDGLGYLEGLAFPVDADNPLGGGPIATAVRENRPYWCQNFQSDPTTAFWHERGAQYGWGASAVLPLHRSGVIVGTFTVYAGEANAFDQAERNLLEELAMIISFALDNFVREAGRKQAEVALRESEARGGYPPVRCKHDAGDTVDINTPIVAYLHIAEQEFCLTADTLAEKRSNNQDDIFELGRHQPIRLLLVEDSDHDTEIIVCLLCKDGINFQLHRVETEASFRQALQDPVDLVIFSVLIPEFSTVCALEILPSNVALIILSGAVGAEAAVGAMKRGAVEYVAKESIGTLPDAMKRVLKVATMHENQRLTQEKLANANVHLAKLSIQLIEIQEQERKNLAREMHDELGQRLTLLKISLHRMREFLGEPRALNTWETMDAEVTVLAAQIRAMSGSLRPQTLDYVGLESAVRQLLESSFSNTRISYIFEYVGLPSKIAAPIDITAYRIVQESVTNIVKHANATQVVVEINGGETGEEMEIVVRDNGIGFDTARIKTMQLDSVSSGLLGLRERIVLLGGRITVETSIGKGARLVVSLPLKGVINDKN